MALDWLEGRITPWDLASSTPSRSTVGTEDFTPSDDSASDMSESMADPGEYNWDHPPRIQKGKLYNVIIGRWIIPGSGPRNNQNVVYPYVDKKGVITFRMQPVDEQGNRKPIPERGWRVSEADLQGRTPKEANHGSYFEYAQEVTRAVPDGQQPNPRERIREMILQSIHNDAATEYRNQQEQHKARRLNHDRTRHGAIDLLGIIYRRQLVRQEVRRATRRAIRRAHRRADRRIALADELSMEQDPDEIRRLVKGVPNWWRGKDEPSSSSSGNAYY